MTTLDPGKVIPLALVIGTSIALGTTGIIAGVLEIIK